jgi:hypothetical protein
MAGAFANLIGSELDLARVTRAIEAAIEWSFERHPMRHVTEAEVKRRFDRCANIFERLHGQLGWGIVRALDFMPQYLDVELSGSTWTPDTRACWMPEDGSTS